MLPYDAASGILATLNLGEQSEIDPWLAYCYLNRES